VISKGLSSMIESNGRIKLTWPQIVWGISLLSVILLTYADLKNRITMLQSSVRVINKNLGIETGE
jgi:hypothetical protein